MGLRDSLLLVGTIVILGAGVFTLVLVTSTRPSTDDKVALSIAGYPVSVRYFLELRSKFERN